MDEGETVNILHCGICGNLLQNPRYLICLHSFCENCLIDKVAAVSRDDNSIKCKICDTITTILPDENGDHKHWIENLPRNNFLSSLVEQKKITRSEGQENFCYPCFEEDGVKEAGSHWCQQCSGVLCQNCARFHKKVRNLAGHMVYAIQDLKEHPEIISKAYELCETHSEEKLESYCYSHDEPCCVRCMVYRHRHCKDVIPIDKWVRETQNAQGPSELLQELDSKLKGERQKKSDSVKYLNEEITKMRTKINSHFDKLEKNMRDEVDMFVQNAGDVFSNKSSDQAILSYFRTYLQNLIKFGTTVQLLTNMKQIRYFLANTEKTNASEEIKCYIEFDEHLQNLFDTVMSLGKIVTMKEGREICSTITLHIPTINKSEQRPPIPTTKHDSKDQNENRTADLQEPKTQKSNSMPKLRTKIDNNEDRSVKENLLGHSQVDTETNRFPEKRRSIQSVKAVDNIAEIEKKLKMFIDHHITKVQDIGLRWPESRDESMDIKNDDGIACITEEVKFAEYEVETDLVKKSNVSSEKTQYAKISKDKIQSTRDRLSSGKSERRTKTNTRKTSRQKSVESSGGSGEVVMRKKRTKKWKHADTPDPEKEKLNALITNYLKKAELKEKDNSIANSKSFYFSTPDIPSSIMQNDSVGGVLEHKENDITSKRLTKRRNSLQENKKEIVDPLYDQIDYNKFKPFLNFELSPDNSENSNDEVFTSVVETDILKSVPNVQQIRKENVIEKPINEVISSEANINYQIYKPQSQLKTPSINDGKSTCLPENGKPSNKLGFLEKAKQKLKFHKKNGKFDVIKQTEKNKNKSGDMLIDEDGEPIYIGTTYEEHVRKAAHEIPVNKPISDSAYEQNFQIIYPDKQQQQDNTNTKTIDSLYKRDRIYEQIDDFLQKSTESHEQDSKVKENTDNIHYKELTSMENVPNPEESRPSVPKGVPIGMPPPSFFGELKQRFESGQSLSKHKDEERTIEHKQPLMAEEKAKKNPLPVSQKPRKPEQNKVLTLAESQELSKAKTQKAEPEIIQNKMVCYEAYPVNDFNVQSGNTLITGGAFSPKGKLFLIDTNEQKLYTFKCDATCEDVFQFKEKPYDVVIVNDHVIAVTFPNAESVDLVDIAEMQIAKTLRVNESCFGIDQQNTNLIIRCSQSIKIVTLQGIIKQSIRVPTDFYGYVACKKDRIYYTHKSSLICIDNSGNQLFVFEDPNLQRIEGIALDFEGNVYLAGMDSNNVWQVSGIDGKQHRTIIPALKSPKAVAFSESLNRFFVAYDTTNIAIYDINSHYGSAV